MEDIYFQFLQVKNKNGDYWTPFLDDRMQNRAKKYKQVIEKLATEADQTYKFILPDASTLYPKPVFHQTILLVLANATDFNLQMAINRDSSVRDVIHENSLDRLIDNKPFCYRSVGQINDYPPCPMILLGIDDIMGVDATQSLVSNYQKWLREEIKKLDPRFKFLDASIWHRYVAFKLAIKDNKKILLREATYKKI